MYGIHWYVKGKHMGMKLKKFLAAGLLVCLLGGCLSMAAPVSAAGADEFAERLGPLLSGGAEALADWLEDQAKGLAPELRETLRDADTENLFADLKELIGETEGLDDDALRARIVEVTESHGIHLVDRQIEQLMRLCRAMEKLDGEALRERGDDLREALEELKAPGGLRGLWQSIRGGLRRLWAGLAETVSGWFG